MNFPGTNTLQLSDQALMAMVAERIAATFGPGLRVTEITLTSYPTRLVATFTSDAERVPAADVIEG